MPDEYGDAMDETDNAPPAPDGFTPLLHDLFNGHTWEEVLQRIAARATEQAQHIRTQDQSGDDWPNVGAMHHIAEKLGSLSRYCGYRDL